MRVFGLLFSILFMFSAQAAYNPEELFDLMGPVATVELDGGYANFVAAGKTVEGDVVAFGGGNHASGKHGATFPWASVVNGRLTGMGFNDMMVRVGSRLYHFGLSFYKNPLSLKVNESLNVVRKSGKIVAMTFESEAREYQLTSGKYLGNVKLAFDLKLQSADKMVVRKEAFKRFNKVDEFLKILGCRSVWHPWGNGPSCSSLKPLFKSLKKYKVGMPGLLLTETGLSLDDKEVSTVTVISSDNKRVHRLESLVGGLERSETTIIASRLKELTLHMQYDYLALYPVDPQKCGNVGVVAYISGLLNRTQGVIQKYLDEKFVRKYGSSAFFYNSNGQDWAIANIDKYAKIKNTKDVLAIKELNLKSANEFRPIFHVMGPGFFNRRLIEATHSNGCRYMGMLETQKANSSLRPNHAAAFPMTLSPELSTLDMW